MKAEIKVDEYIPCAAKAPPVMLCVISFRPGFNPSIFAGVVYNQYNRSAPISTKELEMELSYLGILATLEERGDANKSNIIIPHNGIVLVITRKPENILKDCVKKRSTRFMFIEKVSALHSNSLPSKLSLPVFSKKFFFSLL